MITPMMNLSLLTRREFLRRTVLGGALSWTVPTFLANTFAALASRSHRPQHASRYRA